MNRPRLAALVIAAAIAMSACSGQSSGRSGAAQAAAPVVALTSVEQFGASFDADTGMARLILPISPT